MRIRSTPLAYLKLPAGAFGISAGCSCPGCDVPYAMADMWRPVQLVSHEAAARQD